MFAHLRWLVVSLLALVSAPEMSSAPATANNDERTSAFQNGDLIIGVLLPLHHQPKQKRSTLSNTLQCGEIREMYGIQRVEVTFQTLDEINRSPALLPNVTLGVEVRDSCWYAPVALQQSIELIRDSISPMRDWNAVCGSNTSSNSSLTSSPARSRGSLIGVIGPGSSSVALQVQNLLQLFHIPQIGYSTTSKDLSDKSRFNYFLRVVPSDYYQAQVILDIVRYHNWTYVSVVNTDENYGQSGIQAFRELAEKVDVCIAKEDSILSNADDEAFDDVIRNLLRDERARVVVCFCEGMTVRGLLKATARLNLTNQFLLIGSDGWADRSDVTEGYEREAHGSLSIRIHSPYVHAFDPYYLGLRPAANTRNPWFKEFWEARFGCELPKPTRQLTEGNATGNETGDASARRPLCTGTENLTEKYRQDSKLSFVIKAIYTLAYAIHSMQQDVCGKPSVGLCSQLLPFNGSLFKNYLMNVSFDYNGEVVEFDKKGDPPGRYDIVNFQLKDDGTYDYVQVGDWNNGTLEFNGTLQQGPVAGPGGVRSVCSEPCGVGEYKNVQKGGKDKRCCWVCVACPSIDILWEDPDKPGQSSCRTCPPGSVPDNETKTQCLPVAIEFMQWHDTEAIVAIVFSCLGFLTTTFSATVFLRYNDTPVVKSSTRELSYLILAGMSISHAASFPILAKPSYESCAMSRLLPGISFAMIYASLFTKTNRIARILAGSKKRFPTRKPLFMSAMAQVVITCLLIGVEIVIVTGMLVYERADATIEHPSHDRAVLVCNTTPLGVLAPLAFDFLLIVLCTVYAVKTRNVPENFNEAKFIGFAMYTTCVIWIAFVPTYFGSDRKIITMCMCVTLTAMVTWAFLFIPKLYIILLHPERNNRALFTTSKSIRCHIGSRVASAVSDKSSSVHPADSWRMSSQTDLSLRSRPEKRSLSCQTGSELLLILLQAHDDKKCRENCCQTPVDDRRRAMSIPNGIRITEECLSDGSLSESGSCQLRNITISLGSSTMLNCHDYPPMNLQYI